ncbi:hypothetical protein HNQ52_002985 [Chiayiivirga flava]|uniref:Uncharacterized protein n=1 Tax=Chiayiivirga flava TaxID=659595 RepID=A0A7W8DA73_9GAMM|nr:hypothetical protein [Chiayiivirga flava]
MATPASARRGDHATFHSALLSRAAGQDVGSQEGSSSDHATFNLALLSRAAGQDVGRQEGGG